MSQEEVANLMDISLTSYRKIEKGETNLISERISQLAGALGITEQELLWGYNPNSSQQQMQAEIQRLRQALEEKTEQIELLKKALLDKEEIIRISREIGTFQTSILPFDDCCTVFTPKHPRTRPELEKVIEIEAIGLTV